MIKVYCDKCGKEIVENVNEVIEKTKAVDCHNNVVATFTKTEHYCDECQYGDLTCGFKVGDQVITDNGMVGVIKSICDCDDCKKRGFYEPNVEMKIGSYQIYITDTDKKNGFIGFYQIGNKVFGNIDKKGVLNSIEYNKTAIENLNNERIELEAQLTVVNKLEASINEI